MTKTATTNELKALKNSKALKICYWFTNISYYLSIFCASAVIITILVDSVIGVNTVKYMQLPVEVRYENVDWNLPLNQVNSKDIMPVVGFQNPQLDVSKFDHMAQNMWIPLILLIGIIYILYLFRLFLKTVRENSPFAPENPQRLKIIGYLVTVAGPIVGILNQIYARIYIHFVNIPQASVEIQKEVYPFAIFLGLMIIVIAHVYEVAVKMKIEQDLTI